jgi:hypothetical protein
VIGAHAVLERHLPVVAEVVGQVGGGRPARPISRSIGGAVDFPAVDQPENVGMLQRGDRLDLAQEPRGADDPRRAPAAGP